jgi:hypothetical protein
MFKPITGYTIPSIDGQEEIEISSVMARPALQVFLPDTKQIIFLSVVDAMQLRQLLRGVNFSKMFDGMG